MLGILGDWKFLLPESLFLAITTLERDFIIRSKIYAMECLLFKNFIFNSEGVHSYTRNMFLNRMTS